MVTDTDLLEEKGGIENLMEVDVPFDKNFVLGLMNSPDYLVTDFKLGSINRRYGVTAHKDMLRYFLDNGDFNFLVIHFSGYAGDKKMLSIELKKLNKLEKIKRRLFVL